MSHHHKYHGYMAHNPLNLYTIIILILIVLQWFRVGGLGAAPIGVPGPSPECNLTTNGGLFIIAIFLLIACSCFRGGYKRCGC